jgi:hypothetical protein
MFRVGFEPTIPAFERAKTVLALDRAATVIGISNLFTNFNNEVTHKTSWFTADNLE